MLLIGPGASKLADALQVDPKGLVSPVGNFRNNRGTSTPVRDGSRGRRRNCISGRNSLSSPSSVRPPQEDTKKFNLDWADDDPDDP